MHFFHYLTRGKYYVNSLKDHLSSSGFSLLELLLGCGVTGITVTLAGSFLVVIMNGNQKAEQEINSRFDLERAMDFMADEVKISTAIETNNLTVKDIPSLRTASGSRDQKPILVLYPSEKTGLKEPIVYYTAIPPSNSVWNGPLVIYRWGPTLRQIGCYSDGKVRKSTEDVCAIDRDSVFRYYNEVYIDGINSKKANYQPKCSSHQTVNIPNITDRRGFYICLSPNGKSISISLEKQPLNSDKSIVISRSVTSRGF
jgi:type II secretory pathway component PulJ